MLQGDKSSYMTKRSDKQYTLKLATRKEVSA
jgi:hypothetical protein